MPSHQLKNASGAYIEHTFLVYLLPDSLPAPADRSVAKHRDEIRDVLIQLFEHPIADTETNAREMLSAVLGKPDLGFAKPIFDLVDNPHLRFSVPWFRQVYRPACGRTSFSTIRDRALS